MLTRKMSNPAVRSTIRLMIGDSMYIVKSTHA